MREIMTDESLEFDGSFWPADVFKGAEEENTDDEPLVVQADEDDPEVQDDDGDPEEQNDSFVENVEAPKESDWQEEQKNKLSSIIGRRRTSGMVAPVTTVGNDKQEKEEDNGDQEEEELVQRKRQQSDALERIARRRSTLGGMGAMRKSLSPARKKSMRKSRSHGDRDSHSKEPPLQRTRSREPPSSRQQRSRSKEPAAAMRRAKKRDSVSPAPRSKGREKSHKNTSSPRGEARKVRNKSPPRRCKSMDAGTAMENLLDEDDDDKNLNGSMEFNVRDISPVARLRRSQSVSRNFNSYSNGSTSSGTKLDGSGPPALPPPTRLSSSKSHGSLARMSLLGVEEQEKARRQKMMKRKNSFGGGLGKYMDADTTQQNKPQLLGDEVSIDDTVQMDDSSNEQKIPNNSNNRTRRGQRTSILQVTTPDADNTTKSRRGRRSCSLSPAHASSADEPNKTRRGIRTSRSLLDVNDNDKVASSTKSRRSTRTSGQAFEMEGKSRRSTRTLGAEMEQQAGKSRRATRTSAQMDELGSISNHRKSSHQGEKSRRPIRTSAQGGEMEQQAGKSRRSTRTSAQMEELGSLSNHRKSSHGEKSRRATRTSAQGGEMETGWSRRANTSSRATRGSGEGGLEQPSSHSRSSNNTKSMRRSRSTSVQPTKRAELVKTLSDKPDRARSRRQSSLASSEDPSKCSRL